MKEYTKDKITKTNCSFCSKEIECPEDMLDSEKHACWECFEKMKDTLPHDEIHSMHVDIPMDKMDSIMYENFMDIISDEIFPLAWNKEKEELKDMSRRDTARYMFLAGAASMFDLFVKTQKESEEHEKKFAENKRS